MSYIFHDEDEWEAVYTHQTIDGPFRGACGSIGFRRRPAAEVAKIKAEKLQKHEDAILAEAVAIRLRRSRVRTEP